MLITDPGAYCVLSEMLDYNVYCTLNKIKIFIILFLIYLHSCIYKHEFKFS